MEQLEMMYEGKAKQVFATDDPTLAVIHYKDDATAFNGLKKGTIVGKGVVNNLVSNHLFKMLEANGVKTHLVEQLNERDSVVRRVSIVPIEVIVRNIAAGSLSKRLGLPEGTKYAVTEKSYAANGYESEIEPAEGDITDGAQSVTVTNTMNVGDLSVSKTVNGSGAQARREFTFTLKLENADGVIVDNTYTTSEGTLTVENRVLFIFSEGTGTRKLRISAIGILLAVPPATFLKIADRKASVRRIYIK